MGERSHCSNCACGNDWSTVIPPDNRIVDSNEYYDFVLSDDEDTVFVVKTRRVQPEWEAPEMTDEEAAELEAHVAGLLREHLGVEEDE